ncbi:MAG: nucleoside deaminase [Chitinophagales bacterium]|nr:nucleoside deaminase [Chitinophagales bacterium]
MLDFDKYCMQQAFKLAQQAYENNEVPIGAVVVSNQKIIGKGYNQVELLQDATAHAEILAITAASNYLQSKYLTNCTMYVTLEPCMMCSGAIIHAQLSKVIYATKDNSKNQAIKSLVQINNLEMINHCTDLLQSFFKLKRKSFGI